MPRSPIDLLQQDAKRSVPRALIADLAGKKILVTGASGLIGTHFIASLLDARRTLGGALEIHATVREGVPEHLALLSPGNEVTFHAGDVCDTRFLDGLPTFDIVIHSATYGQPSVFTMQWQPTIKLNTIALFSLFERVADRGRLLFLSTSEVYSGLRGTPFSEDLIGTTSPSHKRACYIEGKRCGETICHNYTARGVTAKIARLALAYGPATRRDDKRVLNTFIQRALCEREIRLLDHGNARRTYCYVADALTMMWNILLCGRQMTYNVGGRDATTIATVAKTIGEVTGVPVIFPSSDSGGMQDAPEEVQLDLGRYEAEFGAVDLLPLREGIARTVEWQRYVYRGHPA